MLLHHSPYFCRSKSIPLIRLIYLFLLLSLTACKEKLDAKTARKNLIAASSGVIFRELSEAEKADYINRVHHLYDSLLPKNFNGAILVAKNGEVLLEEYKGYSDFEKKDTITPSTPFHLASISKTFTGMAVLKLWEQGKLNLEDSIQRFFPGFPYPGITVRMLLSHRSGLPNYTYFMPADTAWNWKKKKRFATNSDLLQFMITHKPAVYSFPNRSFHYCNTNFALLALIIEKVTGQTYPEYIKNDIFIPLGMNNSFVFSIKDTATYRPSYSGRSILPLENMDCIYGDKNVYSTPQDLLKWDKAMYENTYVSKGTYDEATKPYSLEKPSVHNYGLGFRLMIMPDNKIIYHNGWWHGNNTVFARLVQDTATVIILGNQYNRGIYRGFKIGLAFKGSLVQQKPEE